MALSKLGAHALFLNTGFSGPQLRDVCERERPVAVVYDQEFEELLSEAGKRRKRFVAWHDEPSADTTLEEWCARATQRRRPAGRAGQDA